jgi:hypothetical protein
MLDGDLRVFRHFRKRERDGLFSDIFPGTSNQSPAWRLGVKFAENRHCPITPFISATTFHPMLRVLHNQKGGPETNNQC